MDHHSKELFGSWIQAIGTIISAIGSTPIRGIEEDIRNDLKLWGNVLQATGNALIADAQETVSFEKIGNEVQAIGNTTVVTGMVIDFSEDTKQALDIKGNLLQALGGGVAFAGDVESRDESEQVFQAFSPIGNLLQVIGNSLQALGGIYELNRKEGWEELTVNGSWIQAAGSVISALGQTKEELNEQ
jgi:hypothetical protein